MWNARLDESQAGIKIDGRNINHIRYAHITTLMAESNEEVKSLLMKVREESEKADLQLNIWKTKIMASGPFIFWQIDEETRETVTGFIFGGAKKSLQMVTAAIKLRHLLLGRKDMANLDSKLKSKDITLPANVHIVEAMVFSSNHVWMCELAECLRIDAFEPWCWRRLLRLSWTPRRSNQSILKEISPEYSLEGLLFMLKLQYFGHLMWRTDSLEKTLMLGKFEGRRIRGWQRMRWLDGITDSVDMSWACSGGGWKTGKSGVLQSMGLQIVGQDWATEINWAEYNFVESNS